MPKKQFLLILVFVLSFVISFLNQLIFGAINTTSAQNLPIDSSIQKKFNRALILIGEGNYNESFQKLDEIIQIEPNFLPSYEKIVLLYQKQNEPDTALAYLQKLLDKNPASAGALFGMGCYFKNQNEYAQAIEYFKRSIQKSQKSPKAFLFLSDCYHALKQLDECEAYFTDLFTEYSSDAALYLGMGYLMQLKRNWKEALLNYDEAIKLDKNLTMAYRLKATVLFYSSQLPQALAVNQKALKLAQQQQQLEEEAYIWNSLGNCLDGQRQMSSSIDSYQKAVALFRQIGLSNRLYVTQMNLGMFHNRLGKYSQALELLRDCLAYFQAEKDSVHLATSLGQIGWVFMNQANYDSAWVYIKPAAVITEHLKNIRFAAYWNRFLGLIQQRRGEFTEAVYYFERALSFAMSFQDRAEQARNLSLIGRIFFEIGQVDSASSYYKRALALHRDTGDKIFEAHTLANLSMVEDLAGNFSRGLDYLETAYQIALQLGDKKQQANWLGDMGASYTYLGNFDKANQLYLQALQIVNQLQAADSQYRLLQSLGTNFSASNKPDSSRYFLNQALSIARSIGSQAGEVKILHSIGDSYLIQEQYQKAIDYYNQALELSNIIDNRIYSTQILLSLGRVYRLCEDYSTAFQNYHRALKQAQKMNQIPDISKIYFEMGKLYYQQDNLKLALNYFDRAIEYLETLRNKISGQSFRIFFYQTKIAAFEWIIRTLVILHQRNPQVNFAEQAFNYAEQAKSRAMLDMLYKNRAALTKNIPTKLLAEQRKVEQELNAVQTALSFEASKITPDEFALDSLKQELAHTQADFSEIQTTIERRQPVLLNTSSTISLDQIRDKILHPGQVLLEYYIGIENSFLFAVRKDSLAVFEIPMVDSVLQRKVRQLRSPLNEVSDASEIDFDLNLAHELYQQLIQPAESLIHPGESLVIIPDGVLFYLPFETLVTHLDGKKGDEAIWYSRYRKAHYLIEKYPISYSSSASLLDPSFYVKSGQVSAKNSLLAVGAPNYWKATSDNLVLRQNSGWKFQSLPFSEQEINKISREFEKSNSYTHQNATEEIVKSIAGNYRMIHLSAHGILDEHQPMYSGLALAQDDEPTEDGFLQTFEIFDLKLNADLITLSACGTGLGDLKRGEGVIGLTRAFIYAGAKSLVVSLWNVSDASTSKLMVDFYRNLKQGMNKPEALRQAKLSLMRQSEQMGNVEVSYVHPFFWAPFILIGDTKAITNSSLSFQNYIWFLVLVVGSVLLVILWKMKHRQKACLKLFKTINRLNQSFGPG